MTSMAMAAIEAAIASVAMQREKTCTAQARMISNFYRLRGSLSIISAQTHPPILNVNQHETGVCSVAEDRFKHRRCATRRACI
jgi:hypothetical protein